MITIKGYATVVKKPLYTKELCVTRSAIAEKKMPIVDKNAEGNCLCFFREGNCLVDVDHRDIESIEEKSCAPFWPV